MSNLDFHTQNYITSGIKVRKSLAEEERSKHKDNLFFLIISFIALSIIFIIIILNTYVFFISLVDGSSMNPTLIHKEKLITNKLKEPKVDSIITVRQWNAKEGVYELWIKRVIAVGGDTVEIKNGSVYVNGKLKDEPYIEKGIKTESIKDGINYGYEPVSWTIKEDEIFFLGDNRKHEGSTDSRVVGPCKRDSVVGVIEDSTWAIWINKLFNL